MARRSSGRSSSRTVTRRLDLTGQRFGRLVAEEIVGRNTSGSVLWKCRCDCGGSSVTQASALVSGHSQSCGCRHRDIVSKHGMYGTPLYQRWKTMRDRTSDFNNTKRADYKDRGITVCDRWNDFANFAEDMGPTFSSDLWLERIDNERGYEPDNCRWATPKEQARNRRNNHYLEVNGLTLTIQEWGERLGVNPDNISQRLTRQGWTVEQALELVSR